MKKLLFSFLSVCLLAACNSNTPKDAAADTTPSSAATPATEKPASVSCSSFVWFKEGTTLEYNLTDATGKSTGISTTHINKVYSEGAATVAEIISKYNKGRELKATYRCEGNKVYMDMKSFFDDNFSSMAKNGLKMEMKNSYISFPWDMKTGDNLEEAAFEIKAKKDGKDFMTVTSHIKNRKVEGTEKVTTPAGSWDCLKISEIRSNTTEVMGRKVPGKDIKTTTWYSPGAGIVKTEIYDDNGKMQSLSELISIK